MYAASPYAIFSYQYETYETERFSKINKLSDVGITRLYFHKGLRLLLIAYSNGNIDLMNKDQDLYNIADIKRKNIVGSKSINHITENGNILYLSCGFGIVALDLSRKEIKDTYIIGDNGIPSNVISTAIIGDSLFAMTNQSIVSIALNHPNPAYFGNWQKIHTDTLNEMSYNTMAAWGDRLIIGMNHPEHLKDSIFYRENSSFKSLSFHINKEIHNIKISKNKLILLCSGSVFFIEENLSDTSHIYTYQPSSQDKYPEPNCAQFTDDGKFLFIGDRRFGMIQNYEIWENYFIQPEGPYTAQVFRLSQSGTAICGAPGGYDGSFGNIYSTAGAYIFNDEKWHSMSNVNVAGIDSIRDVVEVVCHPDNPNKAYLASYKQGLFIVDNDVLTKSYTPANSTIPLCDNTTDVSKVSALKFDTDKNLWIANSGTSSVLSVIQGNGTLTSFALPSSYTAQTAGPIVIDQANNKIVALPRGQGILVYNENGTISNKSDDDYKRLSTGAGNGALPSLNVYSLAVDKDNKIWIGSDKGIAVIYNAENFFNGENYDAQQIIVETDSFAAPLLESEKITSIAVDGANRKWIGTENSGVFLLSADGQDEIIHFTTDNSPLFSNTITSIAIQPESGEVFIGTQGGIISYRSTATEGYTDSIKVAVFPNPVKADYNGPIAIKGLTENAMVHITDVYGNVIYKVQAFGGQAIWHGKDENGERPDTGVYLVFTTNSDGSLSMVGKFMYFK